MELLTEPWAPDSCSLCGSSKNLTGEHKIKASLLRRLFGQEAMVMGRFDGSDKPRYAQGPKSKVFHFKSNASLCKDCNGTLTQPADRAFERFHLLALDHFQSGDDPDSAFQHADFAVNSSEYLNLFRYFAKILACHIAEDCGPRLTPLTQFARGLVRRNIVLLKIKYDDNYARFSTEFGINSYAAHGGLQALLNNSGKRVKGFQSSLTIGPICYTFWIKFGWLVGLHMRLAHPVFWRLCLAAPRQMPDGN
ncbi:hypothetical protein [Novosphingobium sp. LASN5T]|uniref:hypothetical protein n=1 Tax=Novosphingobium sp. LASN5T TaxID=2491021 RepID=UPI000F5FABA6|nr:hypothetical protein [Novosphingobium sp. LASN5T]RQW44597.1 hypothetical protein EH199_07610 [Novosphingobium sp. LASN5T]